MATRYYSNTASATVLSASVTAAATTMTVDATTGWPVSYPFTLVIDPDTASEELVSVTNVAGTTLTVVRGYDNTTGVAHSPGAVVQHVHSAADFADARDHEGSTNGVHGLSGTLVGTSDAQTLTNKTLTDPVVSESSGWTAFTPTLTKITLGDGTLTGYYRKVGRTVHYRIGLVFGSTTSFEPTPLLALPVAPATTYLSADVMGAATLFDSSAGFSSRTNGLVWKEADGSDADVFVVVSNLASNATMAPTVPWTWATGDTLRIAGTYEADS